MLDMGLQRRVEAVSIGQKGDQAKPTSWLMKLIFLRSFFGPHAFQAFWTLLRWFGHSSLLCGPGIYEHIQKLDTLQEGFGHCRLRGWSKTSSAGFLGKQPGR